MTNDALCPICRVEEETLFHRFRDCPASLSNAANQMVVANWSTLFGVTLDLLWRNRNDFIFSQKSNTTLASVLKIRHHVEGILDCMHRCSILNPHIRTFAVADDENWTPPPVNFVKLNTDGSVRENGRVAGCGGVVRDELGVFIFAFSHHLHNCNSLEAELNGILHGLKLVWQRNLKNVIVETDSLEALEVIVGGHHEAAHIQRLVVEIIGVGVGELKKKWRKVNRDINCVADKLAKLSHPVDGNLVIYDVIPGLLVNR